MKIIEPNTIHERVDTLVRYFCKGNKTAFGRETDILPGVLASITGGRMSKPSFELLQKIMTRYPAVNGDWLVLGREPMLKNNAIGVVYEPPKETREQYLQTLRRLSELQAMGVALIDAVNPELSSQIKEQSGTAEELAKQAELNKLYYQGGDEEVAPEARLSVRLGISDSEAQSLVAAEKIRAVDSGSKMGFLVSELAVREFLGEL